MDSSTKSPTWGTARPSFALGLFICSSRATPCSERHKMEPKPQPFDGALFPLLAPD